MNILGSINNILLTQKDDLVMMEQTLWLIGNITGDSKTNRDEIIKKTEVLDTMIELLQNTKLSGTLMRTMCWITSNVARYKKLTVFQIEKLHHIARTGIFTTDNTVISDCLWTISYLVEEENEEVINEVAQADVIHQICEALTADDMNFTVPALKAIGSIMTSNNQDVINRCLYCNAIDRIGELIKANPEGNFSKEGCWALSNVTASTSDHIQRFIESPAFDIVLHVTLNPRGAIDTKREGLWVLCNAITGSKEE